MSGYVIKGMLENTHPPVWRRIVIPEKITFEDLHEFSFPNEEMRIGDESSYGTMAEN